MLNISIFVGGGEVEVCFFGSYNLVCIHISYSLFRNDYLKLHKLDKNRDFSILFLILIETFLFFLTVKIIEKG